jgi:hypothetical protein
MARPARTGPRLHERKSTTTKIERRQMNTSINMNQTGGTSRWKLLAGIITAGLLLGGLTACRTTHQVGETEKDFSGFLGDYSMLTKGKGKEGNFIYIDQSANWKQYTKVYIKPVELWKSDETNSAFGKLSPEKQQMLVNFFHTALADALGKDFQIVDQAGPDTLVVHAAITEARKSKPVMNLISSVNPAGLVISLGKQAITGTGLAVGDVRIEADVTDGMTGQRLGAIVDERAGTKAWRSKFSGSWGDVKLAFDWWSARFTKRVELFKQGDFSPDKL